MSSQLGFFVFFLVMSALLGFINWHALNWMTRAFRLSPRSRRVIGWGLVGSLAGMMLGRLITLFWVETPLIWLLAISGTLQLAVLVAVALLLPLDLARLLGRVGLRARSHWVKTTAPEPAETPAAENPVAVPAVEAISSRTLLVQAAAGSAFVVGGSTALYGTLIGRHDYQIEEVPMRIPELSRALDGFTIVQLSDIHIGAFVGDAELRTAEELVRRAKPDLIVLTGDLLDSDAALAHKLGAFVRRLAPIAREGVVAISGNHDFYAGINPVVHAIRAGGGTILQNQGRVIGGGGAEFALLGVDDVWARRRGGGPDLAHAVGSLRESGLGERVLELPRILLCHNPSYFEEAAGQVALQLSGHTHGGQVSLIVNPAEWVLKNGWVRGRYEQQGSQLYVNRGFGTVGPPARVGSPPEVTRLILTA